MRTRRVALAVMLGACSGGAGTMQDAPPLLGDGASDGASGAVDLTVYTQTGDGNPDPTAIAIFSDGAGNTIQHGMVDANGEAHADVPVGGSVTVLQAQNDPANFMHRTERLLTIRGVKPGDHLVAGRARDPQYRAGLTDLMTATYTALDPASGAYPFLACADLSSGSPGSVTLIFHQSCEAPTFDLLTLDDDASHMRYYAWQPGLPRVPNGTFVIPSAWQPIGHNTTTITSSPTNYRLAVELDTVIGGVPFELDRQSTDAPVAGPNAFSLLYAPISAPTLMMAWLVQGLQQSERQVVVLNGSPADVAIDMAALPLPKPVHPIQSATGLTWTETGSGTPDARVALWFESWTDNNTVSHDASWEILEAPEPSTSSSIPALPDAYSSDDPTFNDPTRISHLGGAAVYYVDYDNIDGYDAARPVGGAIIAIESSFLSIDHKAHYTVGGTF